MTEVQDMILPLSRKPEISTTSSFTDTKTDKADVKPSHFRLALRLEKEIDNRTAWPQLKQQYSNVRVSHLSLGRLSLLRTRTGLRTISQTVDFLLESQPETPVSTVSMELIQSNDRPLCLCGGSGTGKSRFMMEAVRDLPPPLLVVDPASEYSLRKLALGDMFSLKWNDKNLKARFVPSASPEVCRSECQALLSHLNLLKTQGYKPGKPPPTGKLSDWTFIFEEGHRVSQEPSFITFLSEARKFVRKLVVVSSNPEPYKDICQLSRPPPILEADRK